MRKLLTTAASAAAACMIAGTPAFAQVADDNQIDDGDGNTQNEDSVQNSFNNLLNGWSNFNNDNAADQDNDGNGSYNGNNFVVAHQYLNAINTNQHLDEVIDLDGQDDTESDVGYNSGNNYVRGNAFAAYAGILNASWNTGVNANTQSATNIAAQGTINFGNSSSEGGGGVD